MYTRPAKILIIDDDVELVTLLVDYLTLEGFEVKPAHDGQTGLNILSREVFDLIILDVMMPGMDGLTVCTGSGRRAMFRSSLSPRRIPH